MHFFKATGSDAGKGLLDQPAGRLKKMHIRGRARARLGCQVRDYVLVLLGCGGLQRDELAGAGCSHCGRWRGATNQTQGRGSPRPTQTELWGPMDATGEATRPRHHTNQPAPSTAGQHGPMVLMRPCPWERGATSTQGPGKSPHTPRGGQRQLGHQRRRRYV